MASAGQKIDVVQLREALAGNLSPDNTIRTAAEAWFNSARAQSPASLVVSLMRVVSDASSELQNPQLVGARSLATVLLRRILTQSDDSVWLALPADHQTAIKAELLRLLVEEPTKTIRDKIGHVVGELASGLLGTSEETGAPPGCFNGQSSYPSCFRWHPLETIIKRRHRAACCAQSDTLLLDACRAYLAIFSICFLRACSRLHQRCKRKH